MHGVPRRSDDWDEGLCRSAKGIELRGIAQQQPGTTSIASPAIINWDARWSFLARPTMPRHNIPKRAKPLLSVLKEAQTDAITKRLDMAPIFALKAWIAGSAGILNRRRKRAATPHKTHLSRARFMTAAGEHLVEGSPPNQAACFFSVSSANADRPTSTSSTLDGSGTVEFPCTVTEAAFSVASIELKLESSRKRSGLLGSGLFGIVKLLIPAPIAVKSKSPDRHSPRSRDCTNQSVTGAGHIRAAAID